MLGDYIIRVTSACSICAYVGFCSCDVAEVVMKVRLNDLTGVGLDLLVN